MAVREFCVPHFKKNTDDKKARSLVYQGNPLIQSRKDFTIIGTRLFALGLMTLNPHLSKHDKFFDTDFVEFVISPTELTKVFGNSSYLKLLELECDKLFNAKITLKYTDGDFDLVHVFNVMNYRAKDGLHIQFDRKMKPYLLDLVEGGYTVMNIEQIFQLTSTYAVRLLELCLQYRNLEKGAVICREFTESDLRFYLNVPEKAYFGRLDHFKEKVLEQPMKEIAAKTDFRMSYKTVKEGRRVKSFVLELDVSRMPEEKFEIKYSVEKKGTNSRVYSELLQQGFSHQVALEILSTVGNNTDVERRLHYALKKLEKRKTPVRNKQGYLRKAILEDWGLEKLTAKPLRKKTPLEIEDEIREAELARRRAARNL